MLQRRESNSGKTELVRDAADEHVNACRELH